MVRTAATNFRVRGGMRGRGGCGGQRSCCVASTSSRSKAGSSSRSKAGSSSRSGIGGNPVCPRETPTWQKPITNFFQTTDSSDDDDNESQTGESRAEASNVPVDSDDNSTLPKYEESDSEDEVENTNNSSDSEDGMGKNVRQRLMKSTNSEEAAVQYDWLDKSDDSCEDTKEDDGEYFRIGTAACLTPPSERKRRKNHVNVLTPKRIKRQY